MSRVNPFPGLWASSRWEMPPHFAQDTAVRSEYTAAMRSLLLASLIVTPLISTPTELRAEGPDALTSEAATRLARLALDCIHREYPNKMDHVMNDESDVQSPRTHHPAFYGCFDWHSSVHGHWMLVRICRLFPNAPVTREIRSALEKNLTEGKIALEVAYLEEENRRTFERTYGWAWLLKLAEELENWDDPDGRRWSKNLEPLADAIARRYLEFLPRQNYPIRTGVHPNSAFGLAFAWDYAVATGRPELERLAREKALEWFGNDINYPALLEPSGEDFFSPALMEADLMRRVLSPADFQAWFQTFLPNLSGGEPRSLLTPAEVLDRTDPRLAHLDGLNLSRAWCLWNILSALPRGFPGAEVLRKAADEHTRAGLNHVATGSYAGEHWLASFALYLLSTSEPVFHQWAPTPPMGWNSWDCFGCTVTEELTRANADYMADNLAAHGWQYIVVDIQWYEPQSRGWDYHPQPKVELDPHGRLLPVVAKFPSAANGLGFKPLADYVHSRGLKFGVHLMRGIPREAVRRRTPVLGTDVTAADIADTNSTCSWNPDMYGVDMSRPGAQAYYDSVFQLLASWEIDYVKVDDLLRPYHRPEIEAIRRAIDHCGRPIVLSGSPGATPLAEGEHIRNHANLWRLTDDFWDDWHALKQAFDRCHEWSPHAGPGHWPDPDMLPLGAIRVGPEMNRNWTRFTRDEQQTLMTLFCISRAPLMFGGHLPWNDEWTLSLLTNEEILAVQKTSRNNRQFSRQGDLIVWTADAPDGGSHYLALFNAQEPLSFDPEAALFSSRIVRGSVADDVVSIEADLTGARRLFLIVSDAGDGNSWDHANWIEPTLTGPAGARPLTDLEWVSASEGWGRTARNRSVSGGPLRFAGSPPSHGIGTHARSIIEYELPPGSTSFRATGAMDPGCRNNGSVRFEVHTDRGMRVPGPSTNVRVDLKNLGFTGPVKVRDLWAHEDLGSFEGEFSADIALHGAGLYRLFPAGK